MGKEKHPRAELIKRNPDIEFGTYFSMMTVPPWMKNAVCSTCGGEGILWDEGSTSLAVNDTIALSFSGIKAVGRGCPDCGGPGELSTMRYPGKLWTFLSKNLAVTTTGDTASVWKNFPMYDVFNPAVRQGAANLLADYCEAEGITRVFLDYCSVPLVHYDLGFGGVSGELDLDRDGIAHRVDTDERDQLRDVWFAYIAVLRATLPQGTSLVANGRLAIRDSAFAAAVDGIYLEDFPRYFWPSRSEAVADLPRLIATGAEIYLDNPLQLEWISALADSLSIVNSIRE